MSTTAIERPKQSRLQLARQIAGLAGAVLVLFAIMAYWAGSISNLSAFVSGAPCVAALRIEDDPTVKNVSSGSINVRNLTWSEIEIVGIEAPCSCFQADGSWPRAIPAQAATDVAFTVDLSQLGQQVVTVFAKVGTKVVPMPVEIDTSRRSTR